jgi:hypothetical protein
VAVVSVHVHIEELVLHGFERATGAEVVLGLQHELVRLFEAGPSEVRSAERLDAGSVDVRPGARPTALGTDVARAVHGAVTRRSG